MSIFRLLNPLYIDLYLMSWKIGIHSYIVVIINIVLLYEDYYPFYTGKSRVMTMAVRIVMTREDMMVGMMVMIEGMVMAVPVGK
jgi:hypothetical protein